MRGDFDKMTRDQRVFIAAARHIMANAPELPPRLSATLGMCIPDMENNQRRFEQMIEADKAQEERTRRLVNSAGEMFGRLAAIRGASEDYLKRLKKSLEEFNSGTSGAVTVHKPLTLRKTPGVS